MKNNDVKQHLKNFKIRKMCDFCFNLVNDPLFSYIGQLLGH